MPFSFEVKKKNKNQTELKDIFCLKSSQQINSDSFSFPLTQKTFLCQWAFSISEEYALMR